MIRFFPLHTFAAFQRQLNQYGFSRFEKGPDKGSFYHLSFVRRQPSLVRKITRSKTNPTCKADQLCPAEEPNFYAPEYDDSSHDNDEHPPRHHDSSRKVVTPVASPSSSPRHSPTPSSSENVQFLLSLSQEEDMESFCKQICVEMGWEPDELEPTPLPEIDGQRGPSLFTLVDPQQKIYTLRLSSS